MIDASEGLTLDDGREYLCFERLKLDNKDYLYLITTDEPTEIRFAEQALINDEPQIRLIGARAEKLKLIKALQTESKNV